MEYTTDSRAAPANLFHPVEIGSAVIPGNVFLAPMAGFTDRAFRQICGEYGAVLCYSEMISCEGLIRNGAKTLELLEKYPGERFFAVQIFGSNPSSAAEAVKILEAYQPVFIDLNCGCPVPKVVHSGAGSALMNNPGQLYTILKHMRDASTCPITVKIRSGWDKTSINYREIAAAAVDAGVNMIGFHARTRSQGYSGQADRDLIADLKTRVTVPLFGSGDLFTAEDCREMLAHTSCDGVMPARGAVGNPFIFRETRALLVDNTAVSGPDLSERLACIYRHLNLAIACKGEAAACREMKKQVCAYTKGLQGGAELRRAVVKAKSESDYNDALEAYSRQYITPEPPHELTPEP